MQEMQEMQVWSLGQEDPLEEGMAIHSSILAWRIPWAEEPDGLQSMGMQRVGHDWSDLAAAANIGWGAHKESDKIKQQQQQSENSFIYFC